MNNSNLPGADVADLTAGLLRAGQMDVGRVKVRRRAVRRSLCAWGRRWAWNSRA